MDVLTYSRNVFLPVTDFCRNHCGYCSFRRDPGEARIIKRSQALKLMAKGVEAGCTEALFSMGERPWDVAGFENRASEAGISDLIEYLGELCEDALEMGLLPHTNAGVLSPEALRLLAPYNASMGLMLETTAKVMAHSGGKDPQARISYIALAGKMQIPFTTGLLIGIGESWADRLFSLKVLADLSRTYHHLQEVIIQPLDPKPGTPMAYWSSPGREEMVEVVRAARRILPKSMAIQVPPNLMDPGPLVRAGASDLGGISPVTPDWINPDKLWPDLHDLKFSLRGYHLRERLPIYPRYVLEGWHSPKIGRLLERLAGSDGFRFE